MKKLLLCLILLSSAAALPAQITVPAYNFETAEDYTRYNDAILECCNWIITTPLKESINMIDEVISFIMKWSMGSPDVMILVDSYFMPYMESTPQLLPLHMAGASKYQLERGIYATSMEDIRASTLAGVNAVLDFYEPHRDYFGKDKGVEKMLKLRKKGKLEEYIAKSIKSDLDRSQTVEAKLENDEMED